MKERVGGEDHMLGLHVSIMAPYLHHNELLNTTPLIS